MAISNIYTLSKKAITINEETKEFAFRVLKTWRQIKDQEKENIEVVKNLVYGSLILFYNLILQKQSKDMTDMISKLSNNLTEHIMSFDDTQIINVVLELITLFTKEEETSALMFEKKTILNYAFEKLKS